MKSYTRIDLISLQEIAVLVNQLAKDVAVFIEEELNKVSHSDIEEKELNSLVSYVDKGAEERIVKTLKKITV